MKNLILGALFSVICVFTHAGSESWLSIGYKVGSFFEQNSDADNTINTYMYSPGISLSVYTFYNDTNFGIFVHDSFLFPQKGIITINGEKTSANLSVYDIIMQVGIILGPGFKYEFSDQLKLHYGIGFSFLETVASYSKKVPYYGTVSYSILGFNFGIGGDIGLKYDITDSFYLDFGSTLVYDLKNYTSVSSSFGDSSAWSDSNYKMISFSPYICFGFNLYREKGQESLFLKLGKKNKETKSIF